MNENGKAWSKCHFCQAIITSAVSDMPPEICPACSVVLKAWLLRHKNVIVASLFLNEAVNRVGFQSVLIERLAGALPAKVLEDARRELEGVKA